MIGAAVKVKMHSLYSLTCSACLAVDLKGDRNGVVVVAAGHTEVCSAKDIRVDCGIG